MEFNNTNSVFCAIYRWRLHPGTEDSFVRAWSVVTELLVKERESLGSRLHRGTDNIWYSYTQWPSAAAKAAGLALPSVDPEAWGADARRHRGEPAGDRPGSSGRLPGLDPARWRLMCA